MRLLRMLKEEFKLAFTWKILLYGAVYALISAAAVAGDLGETYPDVWYLLFMSDGNGSVTFVTLFVLPVLAFSMTLAQEWESRAGYYWIARSGIGRYVAAKYTACAAAGFATVMTGMLLFCAVMRCFYPFYTVGASGSSYEMLIEEGKVLRGFLGYVAHVSLSGALVAVFGMFVSTYIPMPYAVVAMPLTAYVFLVRFTSGMPLPLQWDISFLITMVYPASSAGRNLLGKLAVVLVACILMGVAGYRQMRRRLHHA